MTAIRALPASIGPAEFSEFGAGCPSDWDPLFRHARLSLDDPA